MTNEQVKADIATHLPDNTTGAITPAIIRTELGTMVDYSDTSAAAAVAGHGANPAAHSDTIAAAISSASSLALFCLGGPTTVTGTGAVSQNAGNFRVNTGATASSTAIAGYRDPVWGIVSGANAMDWTRTHWFGFWFFANAASATSTYRVLVGKTQGGTLAVGALGTKGYGFELRNTRLWLVAHNGSSITQVDTGLDYAYTTVPVEVSKSASGTVTLKFGASTFSTSGGPSTGSDTTVHFSSEVVNGATATSYRSDIFQPRYRIS
jgi:hypothetical protein